MSNESLTLSAEELAEVRGNSVIENYQVHDVAQHVVVDRLESAGYTVEKYGTDERHGEAQYGHGPDLAVYDREDGEELIGYIEIKSKRQDSFFGVLNRRHFNEYLKKTLNEDVPVFCYFAIVEMDVGMVVRDGFIEIDGQDQIIAGFQMKGNAVVRLDVDDTRNFTWLFHELETSRGEDNLVGPVGFDLEE